MERANIVIIGAGVVGLAIAAKLSEKNEGVLLLEKNRRVGQEISSHNSGVIHSGIHYPKNSLKARLCVTGNRMMYKICSENNISHKMLGKLTVAIGEDEIREIESLKKQGDENGVEGMKIMDGGEVGRMEPLVKVDQALYTPTTGIIEPDELTNYYYRRASTNGTSISLATEVTEIKRVNYGYELSGTSGGSQFDLSARIVINSAGLYSDKVAALPGLDVDSLGYRLHYCKGDYFRVSGPPPVRRLIYPVPRGVGLGVHLTPDLSGSIKIGPNAYYVESIEYTNSSKSEEFRNDVKRYLPAIVKYQISEDSAGVRPKLQGPSDSFRDFVIREEADHGLPGFINLIGIDSPGLTATPAIAEYVSELCSRSVI